MNAEPLRCFLPPSASGGGARGRSEDKGKESVAMVEVKEKEASESEGPWMRLGLGIGAVGCTSVNKQEEKKVVEKKRKHSGDGDDDQYCRRSLLTEKQWHELQEQAIIYKYIASGLTVPLGLVVPIWKSVASSVGSVNGGIYRIYPSFAGFSPQGFDHRNMTDPEPLRCRRTDGKKWRCGKNVVIGQKYCERHMHRGRQCSRKLVEASRINPSSDAVILNSSSKNSNTTCFITNSSSPRIVTQKESVSHSVSSTSSCNVETESNNMTMANCAVSAQKSTGMTMNTSSIANNDHKTNPSTSVTDANNKRSGIDINDHAVDKKHKNFRCPVSCKNALDRSRVNRNTKSFGSRKSQGLDFSPKSVLPVQGGCRSSSLCQIDLELEPWRCKRTDGKKWRCRRDAITNEKYCAMHMHRGAKKPTGTSKPAFLAAVANVSASTHPQPTANLPKKTDCTYLDTNLSISIPASPSSATSTSSDATISDTVNADSKK